MDCFQALPLDEEYPFLDLQQMDCCLASEHPALTTQQGAPSVHQLSNLEQALKFFSSEALVPHRFPVSRWRLRVLLDRQFSWLQPLALRLSLVLLLA
jgi:hypothetical protein